MATRDSVSPSRGVLSGRGGAGNFGKDKRDQIKPEDLVTPTIKSDHYTTGRGGSGNIAKNDDSTEARIAQDVEATPRREGETNFHYGRGGAANVAKVPSELKAEEQGSQKRSGSKTREIIDKIVHGGHSSKN